MSWFYAQGKTNFKIGSCFSGSEPVYISIEHRKADGEMKIVEDQKIPISAILAEVLFVHEPARVVLRSQLRGIAPTIRHYCG